MGRAFEPLDLHLAQRQLLEAWVRAGTTPQRVVRRARIVLLAAEGMSARAIARRLGVSPHTVARWWRQYQKHGPATLLQDAPGRGRKATVGGLARTRIRALLEMAPAGGGRWTIRRLAEAAGVSRASAHRMLRAEGLSIDRSRTRTTKSETTTRRSRSRKPSDRGTGVAAQDSSTLRQQTSGHRERG
jgi:transposase